MINEEDSFMKLGIMGHGHIVSTFLDAVTYVDDVEALAIYNRPSSAEAGKAIAEKFGIPAVYNDLTRFWPIRPLIRSISLCPMPCITNMSCESWKAIRMLL